jgi:hypothetical protein
VRPFESPLLEQVREHLGLEAEVDGVGGILRGEAVPGHVPEVDGES